MYKNVGLLLVVALVLLGFSAPAFALKGEDLVIKWWDKDNVEEIKDILQSSVYMRVKDMGLRIPEIKYVPWEWPQVWKEATEKNVGCSIDENENVQGWESGFPFPEPKTGTEIMWNFQRRYMSDNRNDWQHIRVVSWKGAEKEYTVWFTRINMLGRVRIPPIPEVPDNPRRIDYKVMVYITDPFELRGFGSLQYHYEDETKEDDMWMYIPSLRRVRRGSAAARQDTWDGTEVTFDDMQYIGKIRENKCVLLGKKEYLLPLNCAFRRDRDKRQPLNQSYSRYQAYYIEAIPRDPNYLYSKRLFWIDELSFTPAGMECYNKVGELWRTQVFPNITTGGYASDEHKENVTFYGNSDVITQMDGWSSDFIVGHSTFYPIYKSHLDVEKIKLKDCMPSYLKKMGR
jgi:hypothetical protein